MNSIEVLVPAIPGLHKELLEHFSRLLVTIDISRENLVFKILHTVMHIFLVSRKPFDMETIKTTSISLSNFEAKVKRLPNYMA